VKPASSLATVAARRQRDELESAYVELEWRKCTDDFLYFATTWCRIESKRDPRGWEKFDPLPYQVEDAQAFLNHRYLVVLKARQLGITTLVVVYCLWLLLFRPGGARVLMLSRDLSAADGNLQKMGVVYRLLPDWLKARGPNLVKHGTSHMQFLHYDGAESFINSVPATRTAGAGSTADLVVLDEFGLAEYQDDIYKSVQPTTLAAATNPANRGAVLIMLSTARGANNLFAKTYRSADRGENEYHPIFHPWNVSPFVDQEEYDRQAKFWQVRGEPWMLYSEMPSSPEEAFRESGRPRFTGLESADSYDELAFVGRLQLAEDLTAEFVPDETGFLRLAELPDNSRPCVISVDPASGKGGDYTIATVLAFDDNGMPTIMGTWASNMVEPSIAAEQMYALGHLFSYKNRPALIAVETQGGHGDTFIHVLRQMTYRNLYSYTPVATRRKRIGNTYGFPMPDSRKIAVIDRLAQTLPHLQNLHPPLVRELHTFVRRDNGKIAADVGCHDDYVMSLAIGVWVLHERGSAPSVPSSEQSIDGEAPEMQVMSVGHLLVEAEQARRATERRSRRTSLRLGRR
jgi:hypothetical protein